MHDEAVVKRQEAEAGLEAARAELANWTASEWLRRTWRARISGGDGDEANCSDCAGLALALVAAVLRTLEEQNGKLLKQKWAWPRRKQCRYCGSVSMCTASRASSWSAGKLL